MKKILFIIILAVTTISLFAKKDKKEDIPQTVYLYAISASFNDSIVYITDIQTVDSAYLENKRMLGGLRDYVRQLDRHFKEQGINDRINTVFFKTKRNKAEKQYVKLRHRYSDNGIDLRVLPQSEFSFTPVKKEIQSE